MISRATWDCTFVTCEIVPELDPDDRVLLDELRERGLNANVATWSDPNVIWSDARLCLVRSTWDYHKRYSDFISWIDRLAASKTMLRNSPSLLRWNADKKYLLELQLLGVPIVPTIYVEHGRTVSAASICAEKGWPELVIKPSRGAAAHNVIRSGSQASDLERAQAHLNRITVGHGALIQPYLSSVVTYGERALVFLEGRYSHAVVKKPFDRLLMVSNAASVLVQASQDEIDVATKALDLTPGDPMYARVDLLRGDQGEIYVSEVELVEPGLYLRLHKPAIEMFANAIEHALAKTSAILVGANSFAGKVGDRRPRDAISDEVGGQT